jgi:CubicO group peptidase (beta-lactamase class C family)
MVRHGVIILDADFYPYDGKVVHDVASVTKSVTSLLTGIAIDNGYLSDVKTPALALLHIPSAEGDPLKEKITIESLLTMTSGLNCGSFDNVNTAEPELNEMRHSPDWIAYGAGLPMRIEPGVRFAYCSINNHLLSAVITARTGKSLEEFARERLFNPLGIRSFLWPSDNKGLSHGWADLHLLPEDMAKIGYLYLHHGNWDGKQIISERWVADSLVSHTLVRPGVGYGYSWWVNLNRVPNIPEAEGRGGQRISIVTDKDTVVVFTAGGAEIDDIGPFLLRALESDQPLPENPKAYKRLQDSIRSAQSMPRQQPNGSLPRTAKAVSGKVYRFSSNQLDAHDVVFSFSSNREAHVVLTIGDEKWSGAVGLDGKYRFSNNGLFHLPFAARGQWLSDHQFLLDVDLVANISHLLLKFDFNGDDADVVITDMTHSFPELSTSASSRPNALPASQ